jgi:hypothetical protein
LYSGKYKEQRAINAEAEVNIANASVKFSSNILIITKMLCIVCVMKPIITKKRKYIEINVKGTY